MIIRILNLEDRRTTRAIEDLGPKFAKEMGVDFDISYFMDTMMKMLAIGNMRLWAYLRVDTNTVVGMLAAIMAPGMFNGKYELTECFWYVDPEYRGNPDALGLFDECLDWAVRCRVTRVRFAHLLNDQSSKIGSFLIRRGFQPEEHVYSLNLCQPQSQS